MFWYRDVPDGVVMKDVLDALVGKFIRDGSLEADYMILANAVSLRTRTFHAYVKFVDPKRFTYHRTDSFDVTVPLHGTSGTVTLVAAGYAGMGRTKPEYLYKLIRSPSDMFMFNITLDEVAWLMLPTDVRSELKYRGKPDRQRRVYDKYSIASQDDWRYRCILDTESCDVKQCVLR